MSATSTTLRPGLLVGISTSIKGNVKYDKRNLEAANIDTNGTLKEKWETEKTVLDAAEQDAASKVRTKARGLINSVCAQTAFGYLCPESDAEELRKAIAGATKLCEEFNATARVTRIKFYAITGRVAPDDEQAVKAINSEVRDLMDTMAKGVANLDVKMIRDAASRIRQLGTMLPAETRAQITVSVEAAREAAKKVVAAGEQAAIEIDTRALETIKEARTAFLDLDAPAGDVGAPEAEGRSLDLSPEQPAVALAAPEARAVEIA